MDSAGPVYYGRGSTARRDSATNTKDARDDINDDLADEVEAIRLAADFSSRRLMSEQKRLTQVITKHVITKIMFRDRRDSLAVGSGASASRLRIRALLDKQKNMKVTIASSQ